VLVPMILTCVILLKRPMLCSLNIDLLKYHILYVIKMKDLLGS
jgi:hypothetical protein